MTKTTIILVDDHPIFRQGLRRIIESKKDLEVIQETSSGEEALRLIKRFPPCVVLMDICLPYMNGLQTTQEIKLAAPEVAVIILTGYHDMEQSRHALAVGAVAYFPKDVEPKQLIEAIREAGRGQPAPGTGISRPGTVLIALSPREMEILRHIATGENNKEIAVQLGISRQTVKNHMTSIFKKLSVKDRTQAAHYAIKRGWVHLYSTCHN
jgi:DNA-binding NarL/FixJ family response regulator